MSEIKVTERQIADYSPDPGNARTHTPRNVSVIQDSLETVGAARSLVADESDVILAGNATITAAASAGITRVIEIETDGDALIVHKRRNLNATQKVQLALADNRSSELATWDEVQLRQLQADAPELLTPLFTDKELRQLLASVDAASGLTEPDAAPALRATDIQRGDLFGVGRHRLLCGDSTDAADVARLMDGERAGLMHTDPPWGISFDNAALGPTRKAYADIENDELRDDQLQAFLESAFVAATTHALVPNAAWYLSHANLTLVFLAAAPAAASQVVLHRQVIWVKPRLILGRGQLHWKHEPCFMGWVKGHQPPDYGRGHGERDQTTVWEIDTVTQTEREDFGHATPKPVGLFTIPIIKHLQAGEIAYEPFAGSGPQFIAAEQLDRRCFGLEIVPAYCQLILDRWSAFTGQSVVKL
jgi:DNA modification methylase